MKLADLYAALGPFLEGRAPHAATAEQLFGAGDGADARRLAIYGRFCRNHRFEAVDFVFAHTRAELIERAGAAAWEALVDQLFAAHPMHHVELNENGSSLPELLRALAPAKSWPEWIVELADLEWWEWRTDSALDDPRDQDRDGGPLRLAATVELRPYAHDLVGWLDADRAGDPARSATVVIFWRDADGDPRRENATHGELRILKAVSDASSADGAPVAAFAVDDPLAAALATDGALAETLADLRAAGIVLPR